MIACPELVKGPVLSSPQDKQNSAYTRPRPNTPVDSNRSPPAPFFDESSGPRRPADFNRQVSNQSVASLLAMKSPNPPPSHSPMANFTTENSQTALSTILKMHPDHPTPGGCEVRSFKSSAAVPANHFPPERGRGLVRLQPLHLPAAAKTIEKLARSPLADCPSGYKSFMRKNACNPKKLGYCSVLADALRGH